MKRDIEARLARIEDISTLPGVAHNVIQLIQSPKSSALQVGEAISRDPALSSKVLRMANSAFYGFPRKIATIHSAIVVLGFANIRNIVLTTSVAGMLPPRDDGLLFDRVAFWQHSLACGITSKLLAQKMGMKNLEEAFLWGLLHDLGKVVLDGCFREEFHLIVRLAREKGLLLRDAEEAVLGFDHAAAGGVVAEKWNLPPALIKAVRFHHDPTLARESMRVAAIVHLADILCRAIGLGNGGDERIPVVRDVSWKLLGMDRSAMRELFHEMERDMDRAVDFLPLVH
jgi:putative nucleotidyltransferase with HDIG domain